MQAMRGLSKADTLRLVAIEYYVETGKRPDELQVTDEWIDESIRFLAEKFRPTLEAWAAIGDREEKASLVAIEARKVLRLWKRAQKGKPVTQEQMDSAFSVLDSAVQASKSDS